MDVKLQDCFVSVDDHDKAIAFRAEVIQESMDQSYGRDCAFRDPAGTMLRIIQTRG